MKKRAGFTILEVIVATAVTAVLFTAILPMAGTAARMFRGVAAQNLARQTLDETALLFRELVGEATDARVTGGAPPELRGYGRIWCEGYKLYYQKPGESEREYMPGTAFTLLLEPQGNALIIHIGIAEGAETYSTDTAVLLPNVVSIAGDSGSGIQFKTG